MTRTLLHAPVRKISVKTRGVTGRVPTLGRYESTLERDFMEILRFDPNIENFTPQPLTIKYIGQDGKNVAIHLTASFILNR